MSQRKHRRHRGKQAKRVVLRAGVWLLDPIVVHPGRSVLAALLCLLLSWAVLTKSLPYALAVAAPDLALALNPSNPAALVAKAGGVREQLLLHMAAEAAQSKERESAAPGTEGAQNREEGATIASLPKAQEAAAGEAAPPGLHEVLRGQMRELASKAIASDPLNAAAYRLLAEATVDPGQVRALMREAVKRSRRETAAIFWLLNDSYYRKDFPGAIEYVDILARSRPAISSYGFSYLVNISKDAGGRRLVADWLAGNPVWRPWFLDTLWDLAHNDPAGLALAAELRKTGRPPDTAELKWYVDGLANHNAVDIAYDVWLQTLPPERAANLGFLTDPGFEPAGLADGLRLASVRRGQHVRRVRAFERTSRQRLLRLSFGQGRIEFAASSELLLCRRAITGCMASSAAPSPASAACAGSSPASPDCRFWARPRCSWANRKSGACLRWKPMCR